MSMLRNQAQALLRHERIQTTVPKAKELRMFVERIISTAKDGLVADGNGTKELHARRLVRRDIQDPEVVKKLFRELAPRFAGRHGGYTRLLRVGFRRGDAAEMAQVELVGSEFNPKAAAEKKAASAAKGRSRGVGGRLRAAAERLRSRRGEKGEEAEAPEKPEKEPEEGEK